MSIFGKIMGSIFGAKAEAASPDVIRAAAAPASPGSRQRRQSDFNAKAGHRYRSHSRQGRRCEEGKTAVADVDR
jgi:hypothetical protein